MSDQTDNPFQMDEEIVQDVQNIQNSLNNKNLNNGNIEIDQDKLNNEIALLNPNIDESVDCNSNFLIRSKLSQFKTNESYLRNENSSKDDQKYDEDLDDNFEFNGNEKFNRNEEFNGSEEFNQFFEKIKISKPSLKILTLTPPENFAPVINKIYRSSFPQPQNFEFLKKLKFNTILCLIPEEYPNIHQDFFKQENITLFQLGMSGNKEPFVKISSDLITEALKIILKPENQPILIHCNRGKHRTGCLVGVLRRLQNWSLTMIFDEYRKFAAPKERPMDQQFIELYDVTKITEYCKKYNLLPLKWD